MTGGSFFDSDVFSSIFAGLGVDRADEAKIRQILTRKDCAGCGHVHSDLRPWPPDDPIAVRYCGSCRLGKALQLTGAAS